MENEKQNWLKSLYFIEIKKMKLIRKHFKTQSSYILKKSKPRNKSISHLV